MDEERSERLPLFYSLDESDSDIVILRRSSGGFVAAFSARGATEGSIIEAAQEDYQQLLARALARESGRRPPSIDELPEHLAILDRSGSIMAVNTAWKRFARNNGVEPSKVSEGANYLGVCERATGEHSEYAQTFAEGLRSVIFGRGERFAMEYPCHSPTQRRWFVGRVVLLPQNDLLIALVAHENITGRRLLTEQ